MISGLTTDLYELTMAQVYFRQRRQTTATFDLLIRSPKRPFYVACGIDKLLSDILHFSFSRPDIEYLKTLNIFSEDFLQYLKTFAFKGDVWSVEDPEIVFSGEPIMRITANIIEAQIIESIILNRMNLAITLATKAARVVLAARGKKVYDFSLRRTQGIQAALSCAEYSYLAGASGTSNVAAGAFYKIPVAGTMAHSYIMSFEREIVGFLAFCRQFPAQTILLVDTYDTFGGIEKAIVCAKELRKHGYTLLGIRLDSGNIAQQAKYARTALDKEGLIDTLVFATGDLDEYKIDALIVQKAPVDAFGVGTHMGSSSDLPYTDVIYKLVELTEDGRRIVPTMKLSEDKTTLPGKKQVFRAFDPKENMHHDIVGLENDKIKGKKLLRPVIHNGKATARERTMEEKRKILREKIRRIPIDVKRITDPVLYPVTISPSLTALATATRQNIQKRIRTKIIFFDIDTQRDFALPKGALYVNGAERIVPAVKLLTELAKKEHILIISSQDTHRSSDPEMHEFGPHCLRGTGGQKKLKETTLTKHIVIPKAKTLNPSQLQRYATGHAQIILEKNTFNVFSNPNTAQLLELVFPDEIYVYGLVTEYCVREAVEELLKRGFSVYIIEDAIKEISLKERDRLFSRWKKSGVHFVTAQNVMEKLSHH